MGRRHFLAGSLGMAPLLAAAARAAAAAGYAVAAYHDASSAHHQKQFDDADGLLKKGYRVRSLSVYRRGNAVLYAAVWTTQSGPAWQAVHGLSSSQYQGYFDTWHAKGYRPIIVTATGGGVVGGNQTNNAVFAGVFEHDSTGFEARHGIDFTTFKERCTWAKAHGYVLRWGTIYGGQKRAYAGIWEKAAGVTWDWKVITAIDSSEAGLPIAMSGNPSLRLSFATRSHYAEYLLVYRSDQTGNRVQRHGTTGAEFQTQHDALHARATCRRWCRRAATRASATRPFVAIFEK
jgi:hypothetical protein